MPYNVFEEALLRYGSWLCGIVENGGVIFTIKGRVGVRERGVVFWYGKRQTSRFRGGF